MLVLSAAVNCISRSNTTKEDEHPKRPIVFDSASQKSHKRAAPTHTRTTYLVRVDAQVKTSQVPVQRGQQRRTTVAAWVTVVEVEEEEAEAGEDV